MHLSLGNTARGLIAAAIIANSAVLVGCLNGTAEWGVFVGGVITSVATLAGALIDPGSAPAKP